MIAVVVFSAALMITPVLGVPSHEHKLPISLKFTALAATDPNYVYDPGIFNLNDGLIGQRRDALASYKVELSINGAGPIIGFSIAERPVGVANVLKHQLLTIHEIHSMYFPAEGGGFEGNALLKFTEYVSPSNFYIETHGTFQGTGTFEGQTIIASYEGPSGGTWAGFIIKP